MVFSALKGKKVQSESPIWPEFEPIPDFMAFLDICKFEGDSI